MWTSWLPTLHPAVTALELDKMDRADARREARADRRQLAQNPYGSRPPRKKINRVKPSGLWGLIKSWSFFGQGEEQNGDDLEDYESDETAQAGTHSHPENSSFSDNSTSGTETGSVVSSQNAPSTVAHQVRPSFRRHRMPGEFIRASSRTPTPGPRTTTHMNALAQAIAQEQQEAAQSKFESRASPDISIPGSFEAQSSSQKDEGKALVRLGQPESEAKPDQPANLAAPVDESGLSGSTDLDELVPPPVPTHGLPPFRSQFAPPAGSPIFDPIPLAPNKGPLTDEEKAEFRKRMDERNYEIRKFLDIDYNELYEPGAWDELLRYNRVKVTPPPPEEGDLVDFDDDLPKETVSIKPGEKKFDPSRDPNEGYTPEELMVNPYQRISAFRGRSRHILRRTNNPPPRPKPIPPPQTSTPTSTFVVPPKPETVTSNATLKRRVLSPGEKQVLPTKKKDKREVLMSRLSSGLNKAIPEAVLAMDNDPTVEKSEREDFGLIPGVGVYTSLSTRRSQPLLVATKGAVLDPPKARPSKHTSSTEGEMEVDENLDSRFIIYAEGEDADMAQSEDMEQLQAGEEGQEDDMVDETPQPLPVAKKVKKRPTIRAPEMLRPKNSLHSPINPSPLRFMSKFSPDSPEAVPVAPLPGSAMQEDNEDILMMDRLPGYSLRIYSFAPGSLASIKPTRALMLAKERAKTLSVHTLPDYPLAQQVPAKRSSRLREKGLSPPRRPPHSLRGVGVSPKRVNGTASSTANTPSAEVAKNSSSASNGVPPLRLPPAPNTKLPPSQASVVDLATPLPSQKQSRLQPAASPHTRTNEWASAGLQKPQIQPTSVPAAAPTTSGFNWGAAGIKAPSKSSGSWTCDVCMISNDADKEKCAACESPRPATSAPPAPTTSGFNWGAAGIKAPAKSSGSWTCDVCMISNDAAKEKCAACESPRPAAATPAAPAAPSSSTPVVPPTSGFNWGAAGLKAPSTPSGSWNCGVCMVSNDATKDKCICCETPRG